MKKTTTDHAMAAIIPKATEGHQLAADDAKCDVKWKHFRLFLLCFS